MGRLSIRPLLRLTPRLLLVGFGISALALADGSGGGSIRSGPAFANDVEGALVRAIVSLREQGMKHAMNEIDGVLESNAEDFVKSYVQKGGQ